MVCLIVLAGLTAGCGTPEVASNAGSSNASSREQGSQVPSVAPPSGGRLSTQELSADDLESVARLRIFFGHQSVGMNVLEGVPGVYQEFALSAPEVNDGVPLPDGSFGNAWIGTSGQPETKIDDFEAWIRDRGVGTAADVAYMKLGFLDIDRNSDVEAVFASYRTKMAEVERDFPDVTFLHVTVSVTAWDVQDALAIERYNTLMREEYGATGRLFDLATVLSTRPDGSRVSGVTEDGEEYYQAYNGYTSDGGHLNEQGKQVSATEMLKTLAGATD